MRLVTTLVLFVEGLLWRATHQRWLGERLVDALGEPDENARGVAGIMLAKGGADALPLLRQALVARRNVAQVLTLLGDLGDASVEHEIARFTNDTDKRIATAATGALRVLAFRRAQTSAR